MEKLKVAVLGTGNIANKSYLPYLVSRGDVELFYYDLSLEKAQACAEKFGGTVCRTPEELAAAGTDTILVLTHETQRLAAARMLLPLKPKRLWFEKPLAARHGQGAVCEEDFFEALEVMSALKQAGIETAMDFNYRFFDQTIRLRKIIADKGLGTLRQVSAFVNYNCWSHCIDLLKFFGGRAVKISALGGKILYGYEQVPDIAGAFELENGAFGTILGTVGSSFFSELFILNMNFENALVKYSDLDATLSIQFNESPYVETYSLAPFTNRSVQYNASFGKALDAYFETIRSNQVPPVPGMAGLEELQFEAALRRSAKEERPVDVKKEFALDL